MVKPGIASFCIRVRVRAVGRGQTVVVVLVLNPGRVTAFDRIWNKLERSDIKKLKKTWDGYQSKVSRVYLQVESTYSEAAEKRRGGGQIYFDWKFVSELFEYL